MDARTANERMAATFTGSAAGFGFATPPFPLRARLRAAPPHWSLFLQAEPAAAPGALVDWLAPWTPLRIGFGSRSLLRADFDPPPAAWAARYQHVELDALWLRPDGTAIGSVSGSRRALAAFERALRAAGLGPSVRVLVPHAEPARLLTQAQDQALRAAVGAGYYRVPRPLTLHALARQLDVGSASLSERLRRAEGRVITRFVLGGGRTPWDERTLFDEHPPSPPATDDQ